MIEIKKYSVLSKEIRKELDSYIDLEFGDIPIVHETIWSIPDHTIIHYCNDKIAAFHNVVERDIWIDGNICRSAGINNVITPEEFRGKGYASRMLQTTQTFIFEHLNCELGLLLCSDDLMPFYHRLGWYPVECQVYFAQPEGRKRWEAIAMLLTPGKKLHPSEIDLNGLPW